MSRNSFKNKKKNYLKKLSVSDNTSFDKNLTKINNASCISLPLSLNNLSENQQSLSPISLKLVSIISDKTNLCQFLNKNILKGQVNNNESDFIKSIDKIDALNHFTTNKCVTNQKTINNCNKIKKNEFLNLIDDNNQKKTSIFNSTKNINDCVNTKLEFDLNLKPKLELQQDNINVIDNLKHFEVNLTDLCNLNVKDLKKCKEFNSMVRNFKNLN